MRHVGGPKETHAMWNTVGPVAAKIENDVTRNECPPAEFHPPGNEVIRYDEHRKHDGLQGNAYGDIPDSHECRPNRLFFVVNVMPPLVSRNKVLDQYEKKHDRSCSYQKVRGWFAQIRQIIKVNFISAKL